MPATRSVAANTSKSLSNRSLDCGVKDLADAVSDSEPTSNLSPRLSIASTVVSGSEAPV